MPKISVIVPVYKAEKYLRKCVESIIFGEEQDLEVILVEDCSPDGSWGLCQQLVQEYSQVHCLRNERNSGVSYTRNHGLDAASGQYVLFVDSDDWVSGRYAKRLIEMQEANPGKLVVCGYTFIDYAAHSRNECGISDVDMLQREDFFKLVDAVMMQQLWNKVFCLETIRKAGIRFDESISMGEDYQFVMDVVEAANIEGCVVVQEPLYYYIRRTASSLMSTWADEGNFERAMGWLKRMSKICGLPSPDADRVEQLRQSYIYSVGGDCGLSGRKRRERLRAIMDGKLSISCRFRQCKLRMANRLTRYKCAVGRFRKQRAANCQQRKNDKLIRSVRKDLQIDDFSVISQNCIGSVFCHDMGMEFRSPTINLYIPAADFIRFVNNLEHYLNTPLKVQWGEEYPVGCLDDVKIYFVHYESCQQAWMAWECRKQRVDLNRILVLSTDRDGFDTQLFEQWKNIRYPKLLFTARREYANHPDVLYFPEYEQRGCIPALIPKREFYKDGKLLKQANKMAAELEN